MVSRVGLKYFLPFEVEGQLHSLKSNLLFFDQIGIVHLKDQLHFLNQQPSWIQEPQQLASQLEWMVENNLIFNLNDDYLSPPIGNDAESFIELFALSNRVIYQANSMLRDFVKLAKENAIDNKLLLESREGCNKLIKAGGEFYCRSAASSMNNRSNVIATPIIETAAMLPKEFISKEVDIVNIILKNIPAPSDSTPWEKILDFKNDNDAKEKLNGLRHWSNSIASENISTKEANEKLQWLLYEHTRHMEYHKMQTQMGALKFTFILGAEILENITKLQFGELTKRMLSAKSIKTTLLHAELNAPHREISYLYLSRNKFGTLK